MLHLEDLEQPGFLTRGRDEGEAALLVVKQHPGRGNVKQANTGSGQPVKQVDNVVVLDEAVREHHEGPGEFLLAVADGGAAAVATRLAHWSSIERRRRRSTTSFRDICDRPSGGEGVSAEHEESFFDRHAGLDLHHAARLVHLHLIGGPAVRVVGERVDVAGAEPQERGRGGLRGRQGRRELTGRQLARPITVKINGADADTTDTQRQRKQRPDPGGCGALPEGRPAVDRHVTGLVQVIHHDRHAARYRLDAGALAESELKILDPRGYLVRGADHTPVTGDRHHRDARPVDPE